MQKRFDTTKYARILFLAPDEHWNARTIEVSQGTERYGSGENLEAPKISWASCGSSDVDYAVEIMNCLKYACSIAELWSMDTGKNHEEVLQKWADNNHLV